jgi:protein-disulfide isomerase
VTCAGRQSAAGFWALHHRLFETTSEWGGEADPTDTFKGYAAELGLDTDAFAECMDTHETAAQVQIELEKGQAAGVGGTPAFFVNDWFISGAQPFEVFQETIEKALRGEHPPPTPTPLPPGVTPFDADPKRPGYTYGGDVYRGSADAEIALVGFIDFHSADNLAHVQDVWPAIEADYIEKGLVRFIVKHFPAPDQVNAFQASIAAECAAQQGGFWDLYDVLFEKQSEWSQAEDVLAAIEGYVVDLGMDGDTYSACLDEGTAEEKVTQDLGIAMQNQFPAAPQFFAFMGQGGGYAPADQLAETFEQLLNPESGG